MSKCKSDSVQQRDSEFKTLPQARGAFQKPHLPTHPRSKAPNHLGPVYIGDWYSSNTCSAYRTRPNAYVFPTALVSSRALWRQQKVVRCCRQKSIKHFTASNRSCKQFHLPRRSAPWYLGVAITIVGYTVARILLSVTRFWGGCICHEKYRSLGTQFRCNESFKTRRAK